MKTSWTKGLSVEKEAEMTREFEASSLLRRRLTQLSQEKIETLRKEIRSKHTYENASWPYQQADAIGYERALSEIISLLE